MEYVVLGVQSWEIEDEKTGKKLDGISVHYIDPASSADNEDSKGILPAKLTAKTSLMSSFTTLPGRYKFDIGLKRTGGGKTGIELNSVQYVGSVSFDGSPNSRNQAVKESLGAAKQNTITTK